MKLRLFLDTNIVLDLLTERNPFYRSVATLATIAENNQVILVVSSLSFATANYFITKFENSEIARKKLQKFRILCEVCDLTASVIDKGLLSDFSDFEDSLQYFCAQNSNCDLIITRNLKHYIKSDIPVFTAEEYLKIQEQSRKPNSPSN